MIENNLSRGLKDDGTSYRVLLVDDSLFVTKQLSRILEAEGFTVKLLERGKVLSCLDRVLSLKG